MKLAKMRTVIRAVAGLLGVFAMAGIAAAQKDADTEPTAALNFLVIKDDNGKAIRSAAVILHPVSKGGSQERGGLELKTDADGMTGFDGIPYGKLRVQVLAPGFQTFGDDYDVNKAKMNFTIKLKRPQSQFSIYGTQPAEKKDDKAPAPDPNAKPQ